MFLFSTFVLYFARVSIHFGSKNGKSYQIYFTRITFDDALGQETNADSVCSLFANCQQSPTSGEPKPSPHGDEVSPQNVTLDLSTSPQTRPQNTPNQENLTTKTTETTETLDPKKEPSKPASGLVDEQISSPDKEINDNCDTEKSQKSGSSISHSLPNIPGNVQRSGKPSFGTDDTNGEKQEEKPICDGVRTDENNDTFAKP